MCQCDPTIKTPFCGKPGCKWPEAPTEPKRDYSLLRPFDLEAAKAGELLIDSDYDAVRFVGSATKSDEVCVEINSISLLVGRPEDLFMAPLAWVEGRPVYKGDVLYNTNLKCGVVITRDHETEGYVGTNRIDVSTPYKGGNSRINSLTWQKPKVKKSGWRIVDKDSLKFSKERAEEASAVIANAVVVYGEWEE